MLKRVLCIREHLSTILLNTSKAPSPLNEDQFDSMKEICSVLDHFEAATLNTSSAKSTTVNLIIPTTLGPMIKLDSALSGMKTTVGVEICNFLQTRLRARLAPYETRTGTRLATMLDPRFKKEGFRERSNAEQAAKILETEDASVLQNVQKSNILSTYEEPPIEKENASDLYSFMTTKVKQKPKTIRSDAIIELRQYFEQQNASREADPLEYWKVTFKI